MKLKHLYLSFLVSLKVLWNCPHPFSGCSKLVRIFSVSVAQGLVSLQEQHIEFSNSVEEVIRGRDDEETDDRASETESEYYHQISILGRGEDHIL